MAKRKTLILVLWVVTMWVGMCWCLDMDTAKETMNEEAGNAKEKAEEIKERAAEATQDAKDTTDTWADWAYEKFAEYSPITPHFFFLSEIFVTIDHDI